MSRLTVSLELLVALNRARAEHDGDDACRLEEMLEEHDHDGGYLRPIHLNSRGVMKHGEPYRRGRHRK